MSESLPRAMKVTITVEYADGSRGTLEAKPTQDVTVKVEAHDWGEIGWDRFSSSLSDLTLQTEISECTVRWISPAPAAS